MAGIQVKEGEYTMTIYGLVSNFCFLLYYVLFCMFSFALFFVSGVYYKK